MVNNSFLLFGYYFAPNSIVGSKRFSYLTYYLAQEINEIYVITMKEKYFTEKDNSLLFGGNVIETSIFPGYPTKFKLLNKILRRLFLIDQHSGWIVPALIKGISVLKKHPSIKKIIVTGPPFSAFLIGYLLTFLFKIELIIDFQDPWTLYRQNTSELKHRINCWIERQILRKADKIIFNTKRAKDEYLKMKFHFDLKSKSFVLPNAYEEHISSESIYLEKNKKVILYAGNFYGKRRISYLIEPIKKLYHTKLLNQDIAIHVFGKLLPEDKDLLRVANMENVVVEHPRVDYDILKQYMLGADILFLSQGDDFAYSVPYKLTDYLSLRRPVLAVTSPESSITDTITELDCGIAADINNPDSIYEALVDILVNKRNFSFNCIEEYSFNKAAKKLKEILSLQSGEVIEYEHKAEYIF